MKRIGHAAAMISFLAVGVGWDTHELGPVTNHWESMYIYPPEASPPGDRHYLGVHQDPTKLLGNEHLELSHIALQQMGWTQLYDELPTVIDLNESIYRRATLQIPILPAIDPVYGDVLETGLTERKIPHPARFSGTPDFSYTVADWLNKNQYCPALPEDAPDYDQCHTYFFWLGAALNSSHFGDQATAIYKHYHRIAIELAKHARELGEQMDAPLGAGEEARDLTELEAYVREAELEALIYEAYAQHFLQDRWSSGHMWNRWNAPSYEGIDTPIADSSDLAVHRLIGAVTGMVHGAEAVLKNVEVADIGLPANTVADPMCSPLIRDGMAQPVSHAESSCTPTPNDTNMCLEPGIGDYRLKDMMRGQFGAEYYNQDYALDVSDQRFGMLACSAAGWADVARQLHPHDSGNQGVLRLSIPTGSPEFTDSSLNEVRVGSSRVQCWSQWATNSAMKEGRLLKTVLSAAQLGRLAVFVGGKFVRLLENVKGRDLVYLREQMNLAAKNDPNGTTLARTWQTQRPRRGRANNLGMISFQGAKPGGEYVTEIPTGFQEPLGTVSRLPFDSLPDQSDTYGMSWAQVGPQTDPAARPGRDKHTIYGFFNKAHADYWCEEASTKLPWNDDVPLLLDSNNAHPRQGVRMPVPRPDEPAEQGETRRRLDACILLADRLYRGTEAFYMPQGQRQYEGQSQERRRVEHGDDQRPASDPPCDVFTNELQLGWEDNPRSLHPGYVTARDVDDPQSGPYVTAEKYDHTYYQSIANWCEALPVVNVNTEDMAVDPAGQAIVVTPGYTAAGQVSFASSVVNPQITIHGYNFGETPGRVRLDGESGCVDIINVSPLADIVSWSDRQITFTVDNTRFIPDIYGITIIRDDRDEDGSRVRGVGRARLDVRRAVFSGTASPGAPLPTTVMNQPFRVIHPYCEGGEVELHEIWDCTGVAAGEMVDCGDDMVAAGTPLWNYTDGPYTPIPGPYDEHQWQVDQIGECTDLIFPSEPCPDLVPAYYGLRYHFERLSEDPISATDQTWRITLGWERPGAP